MCPGGICTLRTGALVHVASNLLAEVDDLLSAVLDASTGSPVEETLGIGVCQLTASRNEVLVTGNVFTLFRSVDFCRVLGR